ncbi:CLUMA_CG004698, isoform A [Clunio marinus]|uniref:CLUMA_CG004698, isoform A n=1 Tax=Clunio marinus TaxID=568069 RepID=A0A1J1HTX5_9DIPT|nr:CLUMA_CG004698, isoform A [Clunio marinus]
MSQNNSSTPFEEGKNEFNTKLLNLIDSQPPQLAKFAPEKYRFDELGVELFSDSDRLSYTSLSRSSSLIQFESLERQLQNDSQISGSSPSLYSYEGSAASSSAPATLTCQEINEKSSPIAINSLPTIKITTPPPGVVTSTIQYNNSDSEPFSSSSTSGSYSSDDSEIHHSEKTKSNEIVNDSSLSSNASSEEKANSNTNTSMIKSTENRKKYLNSFRAKNSVDSLSEDSGYCDRDIRSLPVGALSLDSSLPTGNDLEDEDGSVIEEKSILRDTNPMRHFSLSPRIRTHSDDDDICYHSMENLNRKFKSRKIDLLSEINIESVSTRKTLPNTNRQETTKTTKSLKIESPNEHISNEHKPMVKNISEEISHQAQSEKLISISLPELSASGDISRKIRSKRKRNYRESFDEFRDQFSSISSVPDFVNLTLDRADFSDFSPSWTDTCDTVASKNFNLYDFNFGACSSSQKQQKLVDISASCANLTLLNYSDDSEFCYDTRKLVSVNRSKSQTMSSGKVPMNMYSNSSDDDDDAYIASFRSKELSSLLEEISAHFDKNLSILNDREASYEPKVDVVQEEEKIKTVQTMKMPPPKPPPRRTQIKTSPNHSAPKNSSFDRDPTNLVTSYAQSLEKCNFNVDEPINVYSSRQNLYLIPDEPVASINVDLHQSTPIKKRNFVSSTPNLNYFDSNMKHVNHYSSTDNTATAEQDYLSPSYVNDDDNRCNSMKEIPTNGGGSTGILAAHSTAGSKSGLSVSFCPIVSEISWQETAEDEDFTDDNDENIESIQSEAIINHETFTQLNKATLETINKKDSTQENFISTNSQKNMLVEQTPSEKFIANEASAGTMEKSVSSQMLTTVPQKVSSDPPMPPPKSAKNKKSIFSRLSSGFRFSFRGKKNKKLGNDGVVHYPVEANNNSGNNKNKRDKSQKISNAIDNEFVFIPLKDPNDNLKIFDSHVDNRQLSEVSQKLQQRESENQQQQLSVDRKSRTMPRESPPKSNQVTGKPPLPKLPPRIVGTTTKRPSTHAPRASSTPRETEVDGGEFYNQNMLGDGLKQYYSSGSRTLGAMGSEHKIGLIETNLDTDETIINGKTQSLMELGIGQNGGHTNRMQVMQNVNSGSGNGSNVESGRPHKSMEFLLDKENHQRVLVTKDEVICESLGTLYERQSYGSQWDNKFCHLVHSTFKEKSLNSIYMKSEAKKTFSCSKYHHLVCGLHLQPKQITELKSRTNPIDYHVTLPTVVELTSKQQFNWIKFPVSSKNHHVTHFMDDVSKQSKESTILTAFDCESLQYKVAANNVSVEDKCAEIPIQSLGNYNSTQTYFLNGSTYPST